MTAADYPHWDEAHAATLRDDENVHVDIDVEPNADGSELIVRRTVWRKARRSKDQHILWTGTVAVIPRSAAPGLVQDIVSSMVA